MWKEMDFVQDGDQLQSVVNTVMNFLFHKRRLTSSKAG
jgi:hypothetical protein